MAIPNSTARIEETIHKMPTAGELPVTGTIYGPSGVGKTRLAMTWTGGNVLFANIEDGFVSVAGTQLAKKDLRTHQDFLDTYYYLKEGKHKFGLVWVDTFTEAKRFITAQVALEKGGARETKNTFQHSMDDYKQANEMLRQWVWMMRSLPLHVFYVCLPITSRRKGDVVTKQTIDLGESLANSLFAYSSLVGYMTIDEITKPDGALSRARVLHLQPTEDYDAKLRLPPGLPSVPHIVAPTLDKILGLYKPTPQKEG